MLRFGVLFIVLVLGAAQEMGVETEAPKKFTHTFIHFIFGFVCTIWVALIVVTIFAPYYLIRKANREREEADRLDAKMHQLEKQADTQNSELEHQKATVERIRKEIENCQEVQFPILLKHLQSEMNELREKIEQLRSELAVGRQPSTQRVSELKAALRQRQDEIKRTISESVKLITSKKKLIQETKSNAQKSPFDSSKIISRGDRTDGSFKAGTSTATQNSIKNYDEIFQFLP
ncbi:hypothetical protein M3Y95_00354700 [Aphelenchoides besseyi]|nr:hypothetical protein M3Y95_00354700 [Aphelenchoides besseyi]